MTTTIGLIFFLVALFLSATWLQTTIEVNMSKISKAIRGQDWKDIDRPLRFIHLILVCIFWTIVFYWYN